MSNDDKEYETPARGDKAEAIRRRYCLENDQVYENTDNDYTFRERPCGTGDEYLCFEFHELDFVTHRDKVYFIKRFKNVSILVLMESSFRPKSNEKLLQYLASKTDEIKEHIESAVLREDFAAAVVLKRCRDYLQEAEAMARTNQLSSVKKKKVVSCDDQ